MDTPDQKGNENGSCTRQDLAEAVQRACPTLSRSAGHALVQQCLDEIAQALAAGEEVVLSRFGKFLVREKRRRTGRNPKTGGAASIPAHKALVFKPSAKMRAAVAGGIIEENGERPSRRPAEKLAMQAAASAADS
jgi:integration host factor subunit alpha